jgi:hypothetical protein
VVLLSIGLFWLFRQCRNPKIRVKERWWLVEAVLGTSIFTMMLYNNPGFWYARCAPPCALPQRSAPAYAQALHCTARLRAALTRLCAALRVPARSGFMAVVAGLRYGLALLGVVPMPREATLVIATESVTEHMGGKFGKGGAGGGSAAGGAGGVSRAAGGKGGAANEMTPLLTGGGGAGGAMEGVRAKPAAKDDDRARPPPKQTLAVTLLRSVLTLSLSSPHTQACTGLTTRATGWRRS